MYGLPFRYVCDVLEEMRKLIGTMNIFTYHRTKKVLLTQVEEIQTYVNRMEAGLEYSKDLKKLHEERKELDKDLNKLRKIVKDLELKAKELGHNPDVDKS